MIRVIEFFFAPERAWQKIVAANQGATSAISLALLPSMLVGSVIEGFGLMKWGEGTANWGI